MPISAFLVGDAVIGAAIYGTYAFVRGMGAWILLGLAVVGGRWGIRFDDIARSVIGQGSPARSVASGYLLFLAGAVLMVVGL